ncbi:unnamed protein product [Bursaphelenchus okinawaensis]|uniref:Uncharacterized protein n=1 Tax=Bursaphelenchus okinawaensis TaxID=465554 RepID=A0A811KQC7_9BILA|nr:unnamed protein product [Bursaphelenchus okinawaensis]CAG9107909.1 unnamed protein product [Bursaphelenchus okinawaensis]
MVATDFGAVFAKLSALSLLTIPIGHEFCATFVTFEDSATQLTATKHTLCQSWSAARETAAGIIFDKVPEIFNELSHIYPLDTDVEGIVFSAQKKSGPVIRMELSVLKRKPRTATYLTVLSFKDGGAEIGVASGHVFFQTCHNSNTKHVDLADVDKGDQSLDLNKLELCGSPTFGLTKDGLAWTKPDQCWELMEGKLEAKKCLEIKEIMFTIKALVNHDPSIKHSVDEFDLKSMLVLLFYQGKPQTTTLGPEAITEDSTFFSSTILTSTEGSKETDNSVLFYVVVGGIILAIVIAVVIGIVCWKRRQRDVLCDQDTIKPFKPVDPPWKYPAGKKLTEAECRELEEMVERNQQMKREHPVEPEQDDMI